MQGKEDKPTCLGKPLYIKRVKWVCVAYRLPLHHQHQHVQFAARQTGAPASLGHLARLLRHCSKSQPVDNDCQQHGSTAIRTSRAEIAYFIVFLAVCVVALALLLCAMAEQSQCTDQTGRRNVKCRHSAERQLCTQAWLSMQLCYCC